MKRFILSDRADTLAGMRLAGIQGQLVKEGEMLEGTIEKSDFSSVAILMITKSLAEKNRSFVDSLKQQNQPLVVEVPDRENCGEESDSITRYVREAMGIKL